jgi:hypothetical protein
VKKKKGHRMLQVKRKPAGSKTKTRTVLKNGDINGKPP